ncbi:MAG: isoprenylcysteine carboxylmethyltransferase family protein [Bacteroidota bacterium]
MKPGYLIKHFLGTSVFFAIIFISAGRLDYWQGLVYVMTGLVMTALHYTVFRIDDALLAERSKPGEGAKQWDKVILGLSFLASVSMYITAGLDSGRYHWSPGFHPGLYLAGIILTVAGQLLFLIAQKQNRFFSSTVRIQANRGHTVCDTGLYKFVRHPAYMGSVIQTLGFPLLFGSLWSIMPVGLMIILLITRTYLEDKTLKNELPGYPEYARNTRCMIIPYLW